MSGAGVLCLCSYNVHECRGPGPRARARPARIAAVLREIDAAVVGLQELATGPGRLDGQLYEIAELAGYPFALPGGNLRDDRGDYGNALLSRLPPLAASNHRLGADEGGEPRGALEARLSLAGLEGPPAPRSLRVLVTHLGLRRGERRRQAARLLACLGLEAGGWEGAGEAALDASADPIVLLGDLNAILPGDAAARRLAAAFGAQRAPRSFPAPLPLLRLDRILARPAAALAPPRAHRSRLAWRASDHLPVVAELRV